MHAGIDELRHRVALGRGGVAGDEGVAAVGVEEALALVPAMDGEEVVVARRREEAQAVALPVGVQQRRGRLRRRGLAVVGQVAEERDEADAAGGDVIEEARQGGEALVEDARRLGGVGEGAEGRARAGVVVVRVGDDGDGLGAHPSSARPVACGEALGDAGGGGDHRAARGQAAEVEEGADAAAGLGHEEEAGEAVPGVHVHLGVAVGAAVGDVGEAERPGGAAADVGAAGEERGHCLEVARVRHPVRPAELDAGGGEVAGEGDADRRAVAGGAGAGAGEVELARGGVADGADLDPAGAHEGDRDAEVRDAAGEVGGTVDRVDDPGVDGRGSAGLLAEEAVGGEGFRQRGPDVGLHGGVGLGQEVLRTLHAVAAGRLPSEACERDLAGGKRELAAEAGAGVEVGGGRAEVDVHGIVAAEGRGERAAMRPAEMSSATRSRVG